LGRVTSIQINHKDVPDARKGASVAMKIEMEDPGAQSKVYGRHFDFNDELVSRVGYFIVMS
jgi:translation initiation factor 5B